MIWRMSSLFEGIVGLWWIGVWCSTVCSHWVCVIERRCRLGRHLWKMIFEIVFLFDLRCS